MNWKRASSTDVIASPWALANRLRSGGRALAALRHDLNDVVDTAQSAVDPRRIAHHRRRELILFAEVLDLARSRIQHTPQIGRTHGVHAEPITFGLKIANWFAENQRNISRFREASPAWNMERFPARWANASHLGPEIEEKICQRLGLESAPHRHAGDSTRPPCALHELAGPDCPRRSKKSPWKSATCSAPRSRGGGVFGGSSGEVPRCRTSATRSPCEQMCR